ncbi:hypothetical protein NECID01_1115 [Nematocida sp. AWRm77]|nr:hypothetical protein NECID01_1115 [Nematocida sp. AWRm77]
MRRAIEELEGKYKQIELNKRKEEEIKRYTDKYTDVLDGTTYLINTMINRAEEYPEELVRLGFGHGVKCKAKREKARSMQIEEIDSEVEPSSEESGEQEESECEDNDYIEQYGDDDEAESEEDVEDML